MPNNRIAYDTVLMRPACVLVAAGMGANPEYAHAFDTKYWLLHPTDNMAVYPCNEDILTKLVQMTERKAVLE